MHNHKYFFNEDKFLLSSKNEWKQKALLKNSKILRIFFSLGEKEKKNPIILNMIWKSSQHWHEAKILT